MAEALEKKERQEAEALERRIRIEDEERQRKEKREAIEEDRDLLLVATPIHWYQRFESVAFRRTLPGSDLEETDFLR